MQINSAKRRKAISPVLATVILIAITLIAAIAIAGFVFGLFGSFTSTARVTVNAVALTHGATPTGTMTAYNSGTSNANANGITLTYGGQTCPAAITGAPVAITAGTAPGIPLTITAGSCSTASVAGQSFTGMLSMSNGAQVPFSGVFS